MECVLLTDFRWRTWHDVLSLQVIVQYGDNPESRRVFPEMVLVESDLEPCGHPRVIEEWARSVIGYERNRE